MSETTINILLVEDDPVDQMAFKRLVKTAALPYAYRIATSCAEARPLLQTMSFDVAILDHGLGDGTAVELPIMQTNLPIIIMSGNRNEELVAQTKHAGVSAYLIKDPDGAYLDVLPGAIAQAIHRPKYQHVEDGCQPQSPINHTRGGGTYREEKETTTRTRLHVRSQSNIFT